VLKERLKQDVREILAYLETVRPSAAEDFRDRLRGAWDLLREMPMLGRSARSTRMLRKGYRCFVLDDYLVYYKPDRAAVTVYRIKHGAQRPREKG
jgi:plasmid stabilization system protein ParE